MYQPVQQPWHEELLIRGLRMRLTWWGQRSDNPIVLLHGFMDCGATWQFLVDCLPGSWSFVALDWRGFGGSEWSPQDYWFPDYLADLEAFLAAVAHGPARVIAHSMGANIATMYAGIRPERVAWLVNLEGIGLPRTAPEQAPARYAQWLDQLAVAPRGSRYDSFEHLLAMVMQRHPALTRERAAFVCRAWTTPAGPAEPVRFVFDPRHRRVNPVLYRREEAEACWAAMRAPMLLLLAEKSDIPARLGADAALERIRSHFRDLQIQHLPAVGHLMHFENPEAVALHILHFERSVAWR